MTIIATNTMPIVCDAVAAAAVPTKYTVEQSFCRDRILEHGINTLIAEQAERDEIQRIIDTELCAGRVQELP